MRPFWPMVSLVLGACAGSVTESNGGATMPPVPHVTIAVTEHDSPTGSGATLSGTLAYGASNGSEFHLEVMAVSPGGEPRMLKMQPLQGAGAWEVEIPRNTGPVRIIAKVNVPQIGPALGLYSVSANGLVIGESSVSGIDLVAVQGGSEATLVTSPAAPPSGVTTAASSAGTSTPDGAQGQTSAEATGTAGHAPPAR